MKVLFQQWIVMDHGSVVSISKDMAQYTKTVAELASKDEGEPEPGDPLEVSIPDDSVFAEMVEEDTVFLHRNEQDIITFPE